MKKNFIPRRYILVFITFLLTLILYIDRACISVAKEPISDSLHLTPEQMGWVFAMFSLGYALLQTPSGLFADRTGPRKVLTLIVSLWSLLTALTGIAWNYISLLVIRFLFGASEAGAFPGISRAVYSWIPLKERGIVQGINFSGSRIGAAFALPLVALLIDGIGWRYTFFVFGCMGLLMAFLWYIWFRNTPEEHKGMSDTEKQYIANNRQQQSQQETKTKLTAATLFGSKNMWMAMIQYISSNFIFFFCLTWMFSFLQQRYNLDILKTGLYGSIPLVFGALGNWVSGFLVDAIYKRGNWKNSRRIPAIIGFSLASVGIVAIIFSPNILIAIIFLSLAIFGSDMTISSSWSFCIDIGQKNAGTVSGTMNMAGNFGALATALSFPYLQKWTGSDETFFYLSALLCLIAIVIWCFMKPDKTIEEY